MALFYRIDDIRGRNKVLTMVRARAIVSRELKISPLYISIDPDGEYIRVDFATPKPRKRRARPSRRRKAQQNSSSLKLIGIEFKP